MSRIGPLSAHLMRRRNQFRYSRAMPADAPPEIIKVAGRDVAISNPHKVLFPDAGYTKLDLARYYLAVADGALRGAGGRPNVLVRYPNGIDGEFFFQKRAPQSRPAWIDVVDAAVSVRPHARKKSCRATRPRSCGWPTSPASSCIRIRCAPTISIIPTSCASISIRCPASSGRRSARSPRVVRATLGRLRPRRLAEDVGLARHAHLRAHRAALDVRRGAPRRAGARARGRAARAGARDEQVVEGRAPRRLPRLQPEREGSHDRRAPTRCGPTADARVSAPLAWDEIDACEPADFTLRNDAGALRRRSAIATRASTGTPARSSRCSSCRRGSEREGQGDAPWPPHYRKQPGEPPRVQPSTPPHARRIR